jgi:hypothetical protein
MSEPPILDYAPPRKTAFLRRATALFLRILGCIYAFKVLGLFGDIIHSIATVGDWLLLPLAVASTIIFLATSFSFSAPWIKWALAAALLNLGFCVSRTYFVTPQGGLDPDIERDVRLFFGTIALLMHLTLAVLLILLLHQFHRGK